MKLYVEDPIEPIPDDTIRVPMVNERPTPEGHLVTGVEAVRVSNEQEEKSTVLTPEHVPLEYHGKRVVVISQNTQDRLGVSNGQTVTIETLGPDTLTTQARNLDNLRDGRIHVFMAADYQDRVSEFVKDVLNPHLRGNVIATGASYTLLKNEEENEDDSDKYEYQVYIESCDPNPSIYDEPIDLTGRSGYEDRYHPEIIIHDEDVRTYDLFDV